MHDVAAVAPAAATDQRHERVRRRLAVQHAARTDAARELLRHRRRDERGERVRQHRKGAADADHHREHCRGGGREHRCGELPLERGARSAVPRELRADAHEEEERERERHLDTIEVRSADRELRAGDRFGDERVERAEQDRQGRRDEDDVLEEEHGLARERRADPAHIGESRHPPQQKADGEHDDRDEVAEEHRTKRALSERVHGVHDPASREERPEDRERERRDDERQIPGTKQAALLLDHHRVQVRGRDQPRHDRRVLDGIPGPVTAPAEHRV